MTLHIRLLRLCACLSLLALAVSARAAITSPGSNQVFSAGTTFVDVSWDWVAGAGFYQVDVFYDDALLDSCTGIPSLAVRLGPLHVPGYYTVLVRGIAGPTALPWSDPVTFLIERSMSPSGNLTLNAPPSQFRWTRGAASNYQFRLSRFDASAGAYRVVSKATVAQPASGTPKCSAAGMDLSPGQYRWSVTDNTPSGPGYASYAYFKIPKPNYLVIDLSGGPTAGQYPVSHLRAVPAGGWSATYKTSRMVLKKIWPGPFMAGSPTNELGRNAAEDIRHSVDVDEAFYIGIFEVTQRQWELVMGSRPSYFSNDAHYAARPVERVSYDTVRFTNKFLARLRSRSGLAALDLPDDVQWEYACRAGTMTALNSGLDLTNKGRCAAMDAVGRYVGNAGADVLLFDPPSKGTAVVGSYRPNAWGIYDMHGNVEEMLLDVVFLPGLDPIVQTRGGGWMDKAMDCRSASGGISWLGFHAPWTGFRLVMNGP